MAPCLERESIYTGFEAQKGIQTVSRHVECLQVTPQHMAFMVEHTTGIICAAMRGQDLDRLDLPLMVPTRENEEALSTAFTITVDARHTTTTGVSATDRCNTLQTLADPSSTAHSLRRPGHIFPLR